MASELRVVHRPRLESPVLIAAFRGWNDGGQGASLAGGYLAREWQAERFADIDPENFYDFQATRPLVSLEEGETRTIEWPENAFYFAKPRELGRDAILLLGIEPNLRWRTFSSLIVDFAQELGVEMVITLGALLADVPHTRPSPVTGSATDKKLVDELGLSTSRYEGPTGVVGIVHDACNRAGIPSVSLWAAVPHYVQLTPSPRAAQALCERLAPLLRGPIDLGELPPAGRGPGRPHRRRRAPARRPRLRGAGERGGRGRRRDGRVRRGARAALRQHRPRRSALGRRARRRAHALPARARGRRRGRRHRAVGAGPQGLSPKGAVPLAVSRALQPAELQ